MSDAMLPPLTRQDVDTMIEDIRSRPCHEPDLVPPLPHPVGYWISGGQLDLLCRKLLRAIHDRDRAEEEAGLMATGNWARIRVLNREVTRLRRVTGSSSHQDGQDPTGHPMHTESNDEGNEQVRPTRSIGDIPLRSYLAMVAPGAILIQKREVYWMLFVVFLAGSIVGSLLHRLLA